MEASTPKTSLDQLRQAEQLMPGLEAEMHARGYTEEQLAQELEQRLASSPARAPVLPSQHPLASIGLVALLAVLGYAGLGYTHDHNAHGPRNAVLAAVVMLVLLLVQEICGRRRRG